jgi:hypothetical protein
MSCYNCGGCSETERMNLCLTSVNFGTFPINTAVTLTFESLADGSVSKATGTSTGVGNLTIVAANLPSFVAGVRYKVSASHTWTGLTCAIVEFGLVQGASGIVTGAANVLTVCS